MAAPFTFSAMQRTLRKLTQVGKPGLPELCLTWHTPACAYLTQAGASGDYADVATSEAKRAGRLIRRRRHELGMRQPEFARLIGVSRQAVSSWENGRSYPSRWEGKIEAVLGISLSPDAPAAGPPVTPTVQSMIAQMTPEQKLDVIRELAREDDDDPPAVALGGGRHAKAS